MSPETWFGKDEEEKRGIFVILGITLSLKSALSSVFPRHWRRNK